MYAIWHLLKHDVSCATLFFRTGVALAAKAIAMEMARIIAANTSFMFASKYGIRENMIIPELFRHAGEQFKAIAFKKRWAPLLTKLYPKEKSGP